MGLPILRISSESTDSGVEPAKAKRHAAPSLGDPFATLGVGAILDAPSFGFREAKWKPQVGRFLGS